VLNGVAAAGLQNAAEESGLVTDEWLGMGILRKWRLSPMFSPTIMEVYEGFASAMRPWQDMGLSEKNSEFFSPTYFAHG
jgi:hypothetical protein